MSTVSPGSVNDLRISEFSSEHDNAPSTIECSWSGLIDALATHEVSTCTLATCTHSKCAGKRSVGAWSPATYAAGAPRRKANVEEVCALVLDLDHLSEDELSEALGKLTRYRRIVHASHSDQAGDRCVRVVLALSQPVKGSDWPHFWKTAIDELGLPVDRHACDASRLYFLPTRPSDAGYLFEAHDGIELDAAGILSRAPAALTVATSKPSGHVYRPASEALLQRARQRLQEHGPAVEGQGGDAHTRAAWGILVNDYALTESEARELAIDWNATCVPPWDEDDLFAGPMRSHQSWTSPYGAARDAFESTTSLHTMLLGRARGVVLPEILITTDQQDVVDQAERALSSLGGVFVRGRTLVHVVRDRSAPGWLRRPEGAPVIEMLPAERLRELLGAAAHWKKINQRNERVPAMVPTWVVETLLARGQWTLPVIEGVTDSPVLRSDGTVQERAGYDPATRMIFDPCGVVYQSIPTNPTQTDAARALEELLEPFCDFPFVAACDRSAAAGLILSLVARTAIDGPVPLFAVGAPTPGSGKGLVIDAASMIATGRAAPKMAPCESDDEMRKRLLAIGIESPRLVTIDNVEGEIGSPSLAMTLTTGEVSDRILGSSKTITVSVRSVWAITGNNVRLRGDLGRRVVPIHIDPLVEHPEDREGFRYPNLLAHLRDQRPRLIVAALTVLRAYFAAGRPRHGKPEKGSFENWDRIVRGAIIWAGAEDPLVGVERIREQGDDDLENLRTLVESWETLFGNEDVLLSKVIAETTRVGMASDEHAPTRFALRDALTRIANKNGSLDPIALGYALRKIKGRIVSGRSLQSGKHTKHGTPWRVALALPSEIPNSEPLTTTRGDDGDEGDDVPSSIENSSSFLLGLERSSPSSSIEPKYPMLPGDDAPTSRIEAELAKRGLRVSLVG